MTLYSIIDNIDSFFFFVLGLSVAYLFFFAVIALRKRQDEYPPAKKLHRFVVLFPAYKEDAVIENAIVSLLQQNYPKDKYDIIVISDRMQEETNQRLERLPINVLKVNFENSTKAKALNFAIQNTKAENYDMVVIMDADNTVEPSFLQKINNAYYSGALAIQTHRMAKNQNTTTAILDAVSEEINNSIFRKGQVRIGFSSALIGSGMALDYKWFIKHINQISSTGEDKELEAMLLKENIFIEYLEHVHVYDEKTQKDSVFYNQRRRWMASQLNSLKNNIANLPYALVSGKLDYANKIIQWMMLPRIILLGFIPIFSLFVLPIDWMWAIKWWGLELVLIISLSLAVPDYLVTDQFKKAIWKAPKLFVLMTINLFRLKGANKEFIHTEHGDK